MQAVPAVEAGEQATMKRVQMDFSEEAWATLTALAVREGRTPAEVVRRAIALECWWQQTTAEGARIFVQERGGSLSEAVMP